MGVFLETLVNRAIVLTVSRRTIEVDLTTVDQVGVPVILQDLGLLTHSMANKWKKVISNKGTLINLMLSISISRTRKCQTISTKKRCNAKLSS